MTTTTYNTFEEVSKKDMSIINTVKKYIGTEKTKRFKSFKTFWKKYEGNIFIIGNGTEEDPQYNFALLVENPGYIGQPYTIRLFND